MAASSKPGVYANKKAARSKTSKLLEGLGQSAKADPSVLSPAALMALGLAGVAVAAVPDKSQNAPPVPKNDAALAGATGFSDRVAKEAATSVAPPNVSDLQLQLADLIDDLQAHTVLGAAAPGMPTVPSESASEAEVVAPQQPYQADLFSQLGDGAAVVSVVAEPVLLAQAVVPAVAPQAAAATAAPAAGEAAGAAAEAPLLQALLLLGALGVVSAGSSGSSSSSNTTAPDTIAPVMKSMVANGVAKTITLTFNEAIDAANLPDKSKFVVSTGGVANTVASISATGAEVTLTLTNVFADGTRVDLSYTDPTSGNDAKAIQDAAGNDALGFSNLPVADGYVRGASVYADANNNGKADAGELLGTTDAGGNFFLPAGTKGAIIAVGGVNIDTGVANTIELKAPEGSTTVNPLTTLVQAVVQANGGAVTTATIATAMATVATSLGLTGTDLLKFDPISAFKDAAANPATKAAAEAVAVAAQKAATQVATIVALAEKAAPGAGATVVSNLATVVKTAATSVTPAVNLSASTTIDSMIGTTLDKVLPAEKTAARDSIGTAATAISTATDLTALSAAQGQALDKTAPAAPTSVVVASISNDTTPAVRVNIDTTSLLGKAANVGDIVTLNEGGAIKATATLTAADIAAGYKTVDVAIASALADGDHSLTVVITDRAGNVGAASAVVVVKIDTIAPVAPVVSAVSTDNLVSAVEKAAGVAVSGTAEAGATVAVTWGATVKTATATVGGTWSTSFSGTEVPADASTTISAVATDVAGNAGVAGTRAVTVDTTAPTISAASPADNGLSLGLASNLVMSSAEALAKGTGSLSLYKSGNVLVEAIDVTGSRVTLSEDKKSISIDPTADLVKDETYYVKASAGAFTDTAGNPWAGISNATDWNFTGAGATVLVNAVSTDNKINLSESGSAITVTGTLGAEAAVLAAYKVSDMTALLRPASGTDITLTNLSYTYTNGATGAWSAVLPASAVSGTAAYTLLVSFKGTDGAALNINGDGTQVVQVDTVVVAPSLALTTDSGSSISDKLTNNAALTLNGETGATFEYSANGTSSWSSVAPTPSTGANTVYARQTDAAGNISVTSSAFSFSYDASSPTVSAVAISSATGIQASTLNVGDVVSATVTLSEATSVATTGGTPQVALNIGGTTVQAAYASGTGSTALVFNYTVLAGQTDANGISIAANSLLLNGGTLLDAAGNAATLSHALVADNASYMVDTTAPTVILGAPTSLTASGETFTFNFSESVTGFNVADIVLVGGTAATVAGSGASYTSVISPTASTTPLAFSVNVPAAAATDAAGNASTAATAFTRSILVGTSANEILTVNDLLNNIFLNAGGDDIVKLGAATGSTVATTDVVSGFSAGDKIDLSAILGSATGGAGFVSSGFADTGAGFIELKNLALVKNTATTTTTVTFDVAFDAATLGGSKINGAVIDLFYNYASVADGGAVSPKYTTTKFVWSTVTPNLSIADNPIGTLPNGKIALLADTGSTNPIIITANTSSGVVLSAELTLTGLLNTFQIGLESKANGGTTEINTADGKVYGAASDSGGLLALGISKTAGAALGANGALEIVSDTTALGTVGDNQLRMLVAPYDTANGLTHLQVQYDTNSAYGTGKTTASSVIAIDFVGDVTALLTPASLTFI